MPANKVIEVVLVEDHKLIRELVKLSLQGPVPGANEIVVVAEAGDGVEALGVIAEAKPDVVIMDINMPRMGGIETTQRLKQISPQIRVVMLTASHEDEDIVRALSAGADGYCTKGVDSRQLIEAIKAVYSGSAWIDPTIARDVIRVWGSAAEEIQSGHQGQLAGASPEPANAPGADYEAAGISSFSTDLSSTQLATLRCCQDGICSVDPSFMSKLRVTALSRLSTR